MPRSVEPDGAAATTHEAEAATTDVDRTVLDRRRHRPPQPGNPPRAGTGCVEKSRVSRGVAHYEAARSVWSPPVSLRFPSPPAVSGRYLAEVPGAYGAGRPFGPAKAAAHAGIGGSAFPR